MRKVLVQADIGRHGRAGRDHERVAVGRRPHHRDRAGHRAGAWPILDDEGFAVAPLELGADQAREDAVHAPGSGRRDNGDAAARVVVGERATPPAQARLLRRRPSLARLPAPVLELVRCLPSPTIAPAATTARNLRRLLPVPDNSAGSPQLATWQPLVSRLCSPWRVQCRVLASQAPTTERGNAPSGRPHGEADATDRDRGRGNDARLPRGRRWGDRSLPARRRGRVVGPAARCAQHPIPGAGTGTSRLRPRKDSGLDAERGGRCFLLSRSAPRARPSRRPPRRARAGRLDRGRDRDPQQHAARLAGAACTRRRRKPGAPFDDIFAWTEEFARRQFHNPELARDWQRAQAGSTSTSCCRTAPHSRGWPGTRACTIRNWPVAAPHRCSNLAGLGRGGSGGPVRVPRRSSAPFHGPSSSPCRSRDTRCRSSARERSRRGSRRSFREQRDQRDEDVLFPPNALCGSGSQLYRPSQLGLGHAAQLLFDPAVGEKLYARYIGELELADRLGSTASA